MFETIKIHIYSLLLLKMFINNVKGPEYMCNTITVHFYKTDIPFIIPDIKLKKTRMYHHQQSFPIVYS